MLDGKNRWSCGPTREIQESDIDSYVALILPVFLNLESRISGKINLIFPRNSGLQVKSSIMIQDEVFYEQAIFHAYVRVVCVNRYIIP